MAEGTIIITKDMEIKVLTQVGKDEQVEEVPVSEVLDKILVTIGKRERENNGGSE